MGARYIIFLICIAFWITLVSYISFLQNFLQIKDFHPKTPLVAVQTSMKSKFSIGQAANKHYLSEYEISNYMNDTLDFSDPMLSKLYLFKNSTVFKLGEEIKVKVDMYKTNGQRKQQGGDYLRVWMEDRYSGASVSGDVSDLKNGSYTAVLKAVWAGKATIKVCVASLREEIYFLNTLFHEHGSIWPIYARYGHDRERYECKNIPFKNEIKYCNFTRINGGFPWFCKYPKVNGNNSCDDLRTYSSGTAPNTERHVHKDIFKLYRDPRQALFKQTIYIFIKEADMKAPLLPPPTACNKLSPQETWTRKHPNGYFRHDTWQTFLCTDTLDRKLETYGNCLRDRTLWIPGDSTSLQFYKYFVKMFNGSISKLPRHQPVSYTNSDYDFKVEWRPHEMPFFHGAKAVNVSVHGAEHMILQHLPNTTRDYIVLYLYVHFTLVHPAVFRRHVNKLVLGTRVLLARSPRATVAIRGPHAFYRSVSVKGGLSSHWGLLYIDILHEEFNALKRKVIFLDFWDLSVARATYSIHPDNQSITTMVHNMMSLLCFRDSS